LSACINYTTQGLEDTSLKSPLSEKLFFVLWVLIPRRTTFKFEYLREFVSEFEIVLGYESGAHMGLIHEKKQRPKISFYCTVLKGEIVQEPEGPEQIIILIL
jgi:hypothetical protein